MTAVIVSSAFAPFMKDPNPRSEVVTQTVLGETAIILEQRGDWFSLRREVDGYVGWSHRGYLKEVSDAEASSWLGRAIGRADAAILRDTSGRRIGLPLLARVAPVGEFWALPSGWQGRLDSGTLLPAEDLIRRARKERVIDWVVGRFSGSSYFWGGITPWGVDCSGLVQTAFAARGVNLPRDSSVQASCGDPVATDAMEADDLAFFSDNGERITHVAFLGDDETLVHSTLACGGFVVESWRPGTRAARLRDQLVTVRRIPEPRG
ncbi:MAG: NlpC/P60 family protein [Gemmatimonadota bacterium]